MQDDPCEGTIGDPYLVVGFAVLAWLVMYAWGGMFRALRRTVLERPRPGWVMPTTAAAWWLIASAVVLNTRPTWPSWVFLGQEPPSP